MNLSRANLQGLAEARFADACLLLENGRYSSAFYLAGYAVELGLKACVSQQFRQDEIPDKQLLGKVLTHDFSKLVALAGLNSALQRTQRDDATFQAYWGIVNEWDSDSRYDMVEALSAQRLLQAIGDPKYGVMQWIRRHW